MEQRNPAPERSRRNHVDTFQFAPTIRDTALQPDCNRALACSDLRLGIANFRMGPARDVSLGRVTIARDRRS